MKLFIKGFYTTNLYKQLLIFAQQIQLTANSIFNMKNVFSMQSGCSGCNYPSLQVWSKIMIYFSTKIYISVFG